MSQVKAFEISLEHDIDEQYQYEPGEVLRGHIILDLASSIEVKAIVVQIKGEANVSWEEEGKSEPTIYQAEEIYVDSSVDILSSDGVVSTRLDAGRHRFPLDYRLPDGLPSSFIGKFGSITYVVKATLREDKRFNLSTLITSEPFLVLRRLDLSDDENLSQPVTRTAEKRLFGALAFCMSGKVSTTLNIDRMGHLPGEDIYLDAEISNSSPRLVKAVQASLIMVSVFRARNRKRHSEQVVNKKRDDWEMDYGEGRRWKNVRLTIPPYIPESRLDGCDIIDIHYELVFKIEVSGGSQIKVNVPITVGTANGTNAVVPRSRTSAVIAADGDKNGGSAARDDDGYVNVPQGVAPEMNGAADADNVSIDLDEEEAEKFRYPMAPGTTRHNPIFDNQ